MAVETEVATVPELALADSDNNRARQSFILLVLSSLIIIQQGLLHPTAVVKTRMQAADSGLSHMLRNDAFEVSKDMILKYTEGLDMPEATRVSIVNGVAGGKTIFFSFNSCAVWNLIVIFGVTLNTRVLYLEGYG
ncbi:hypothetical protein POPTR_010G152501v4 [Populus trichocarpa]|uniref:Uncharacterized protein n=1 Tax=Populus trichocarpa TaxID=3694 RepID=A0ACC0SDL5_POPTR|nr:hypothetical protein POPTR_010G152501v4 [Populus trichocarpa]